MKIAIGSDHAGFKHKTDIINFLKTHLQAEVLDVGTFSEDSVDYPEYAHAVAQEVLVGADFGILVCGSGNGVSMAANKYKKIRSAVCWNKEISKLARNHNNANIISLPARFLSVNEAQQIKDPALLPIIHQTFESL